MKEILNKAKAKAGQLSRDVRPSSASVKRSADFALDTAGKVADGVGRLGKDALRSDMAKDAVAGAAIGAVIAVPVPLIGPIAGAVIGAGLGVYKNIVRGSAPRATAVPPSPDNQTIIKVSAAPSSTEKFEHLDKLHELKLKGVLTPEEFAVEKKKILDR